MPRPARQFFSSFIDREARPGSRNLLHLIFDPEGMRPFIENWKRSQPDSYNGFAGRR
jgi:hypothetical protein